jgi:hypothetical protein
MARFNLSINYDKVADDVFSSRSPHFSFEEAAVSINNRDFFTTLFDNSLNFSSLSNAGVSVRFKKAIDAIKEIQKNKNPSLDQIVKLKEPLIKQGFRGNDSPRPGGGEVLADWLPPSPQIRKPFQWVETVQQPPPWGGRGLAFLRNAEGGIVQRFPNFTIAAPSSGFLVIHTLKWYFKNGFGRKK